MVSKLVRKLIGDVLRRELPNANVIACDGIEDRARGAGRRRGRPGHHLAGAADGDGTAIARIVREAAGQAYVPVIVVSGDVQSRLESRSLSEDVTDYFDKALGQQALAAFIPWLASIRSRCPSARALRRGQPRGRAFRHQAHARGARDGSDPRRFGRGRAGFPARTPQRDDVGTDLLLSDVYLKGALSGPRTARPGAQGLGYSKRRLPVVVMTGDDNREHQASLLREGANDQC